MNGTFLWCRDPGFWGAFGELLEQLQKLVKSMGRSTIRVTGASSGYGLLGGVWTKLSKTWCCCADKKLQDTNTDCWMFCLPVK